MTGSQTEFSPRPASSQKMMSNKPFVCLLMFGFIPGLPQCEADSVSSVFNLSGKILHLQHTETGTAQVQTIGRAFRNISTVLQLAVNSTMGCGYPLVWFSACPAHIRS